MTEPDMDQELIADAERRERVERGLFRRLLTEELNLRVSRELLDAFDAGALRPSEIALFGADRADYAERVRHAETEYLETRAVAQHVSSLPDA